MSDIVTWAIIGAGIVLASNDGGFTSSGCVAAQEKFLHKQGLPVTPRVRGVVRQRLESRGSAAQKLGGAGLVAGLGAASVAQMLGHGNLTVFLMLACLTVGLSAGTVIGSERLAADPDPQGPRVARTREVTVADYLTRAERAAVWVSAGCVAVSAGIAAVVGTLSPAPPEPLAFMGLCVLAVVSLGAMTGCAVAACRVVRRPQRAASDLHLAWDDAIRTGAVRELNDLAVIIALVAVLALHLTAAEWVMAPEVRVQGMDLTAILGATAGIAGLVCWILTAAVWLPGRLTDNPSRANLWAGRDFTTGDDGTEPAEAARAAH